MCDLFQTILVKRISEFLDKKLLSLTPQHSKEGQLKPSVLLQILSWLFWSSGFIFSLGLHLIFLSFHLKEAHPDPLSCSENVTKLVSYGMPPPPHFWNKFLGTCFCTTKFDILEMVNAQLLHRLIFLYFSSFSKSALQCFGICLLGFSFFDGLYLETKEGGKWRKNNLLSSSIGNTLVAVGCEL
jgi:hypothetical protein